MDGVEEAGGRDTCIGLPVDVINEADGDSGSAAENPDNVNVAVLP